MDLRDHTVAISGSPHRWGGHPSVGRIGFITHRRSRKGGWDCYAGTPQKAASTSLINNCGHSSVSHRLLAAPYFEAVCRGLSNRGGVTRTSPAV